MVDPLLRKIKRFVQTKELPEHRLHRSLIKNHGPSCFIEDGLLEYHDEQPGKLLRDLIVLAAEDHAATVAESHSSLEGGHEGPEKMIDRIKKPGGGQELLVTHGHFTTVAQSVIETERKKRQVLRALIL